MACRNPRWRPSSNRSLNKVSQLFESKWATPRDHAEDAPDTKPHDRITTHISGRISEDSSSGLPLPTEVVGKHKTEASAVEGNGNLAAAAEGWLVFPQPPKDSATSASAEEEGEASSKAPAQEDTGGCSK